MLATTTSSPIAALDLGGPPWVRPDGVALVEDAVDLTIGILLAPINVTLDGAYHDDTVWTGMTNALPVTQASSSSATCSDWSSTTGSGTVAFASRSGQQWFRSTMQPPCTEARRLYCFEQ